MSQTYRICFVTGAYPKYMIGGAELQLYLLARELVKLGHEIHFTTFDYGQKTDDITVDEDIIIHKIKYKIPFLGFLFSLWRVLRDADADIYLNRALGYTMATLAFAKLYKKKFIYAVSSINDCIPRRIIRSVPHSLLGSVRDRVNQIAMCKADKVITQAEYQKELLKKNFNVNSIIIKNGLPVPTELLPKKNPPVVLWLASLKRLKQAEIFIKLARHCEDFDCRFTLAGRASDRGYWAEILKQMQGLSNIEYVGGVTFDEGNDLIGRASVFVNTSAYEGFPNTFIQAWMREVPVVSLNVDPDDVLSREGIGFKSNTFEGLCRDVRPLVEDKDLRETMGRKARLYALKNHSVESMTDNFLQVIQSIV